MCQVRKNFLEEDGLATLLEMIFRKGDAALSSGQEAPIPDLQARNVLNALIKAEGEQFSTVFAQFLQKSGVPILSSRKQLLKSSLPFADFVAKLLWIAWDEEAQRAFLHEQHIKEALGLLGALPES